MFDGYIHLSHCNLHSLLCLGVVFTPMVKLHSMSKSTTGCTTGCVFFKFDVIFLLCHIGLFALPLPSGHMVPQLKCIFASWNSQMLTTQLVSFQFCCVFCLFWCFCMYVFHCCVGATPSPMAVSMFVYIFNTLYIYFICGHFGGMHVVSVFVFAFGCCMWSCFGFLGCPLLLFYGSLLLVIFFPFNAT